MELGGNQIDFIQYYCNYCLEFITKYYEVLEKCEEVNLDIIIEQLFLGLLAKEQNIRIACYNDLSTTDDHIPDFFNFTGLPEACDYIHVMGAKKFPSTCEQLEQRVRIDYPEQYERVIRLLENEAFISTSQLNAKPSSLNSIPPHHFYRTMECLNHIGFPFDKNDLTNQDSYLLHLSDFKSRIDQWLASHLVEQNKITVIQEIFDFENEKFKFIQSLPSLDFVNKTKHEQSVLLNSTILKNEIDNVTLKISNLTFIMDHQYNWAEPMEFRIQENRKPFIENLSLVPENFRIVIFIYPGIGICREYLCNDLDILVLNEFAENEKLRWRTIIENVIKEIGVTNKDIETNLKKALRERLKYFIYQQALSICE